MENEKWTTETPHGIWANKTDDLAFKMLHIISVKSNWDASHVPYGVEIK